MAPTAPLVIDLDWTHDKRFAVTTAHHAFVVDGASVDGPSPVELLGVALAGCNLGWRKREIVAVGDGRPPSYEAFISTQHKGVLLFEWITICRERVAGEAPVL